jgi:hypothetical protein
MNQSRGSRATPSRQPALAASQNAPGSARRGAVASQQLDNDLSFARAFVVAPPPAPPAPQRRYQVWDNVTQPQWLSRRARFAPICVDNAAAAGILFGNKAKAKEKFGNRAWTLTHTLTDGPFYGRRAHPGIVAIAVSDLEPALTKLYRDIADDVDAVEQGFGRRLFFSETGPTDADALTVMFFDLDCYLKAIDPSQPLAEAMPSGLVFAEAVQRLVASLYVPVNNASVADCIVAATPAVPDDKHGGCKVGVHLYWPNILVTVSQHRAVRRFVVKELVRTIHRDDLLPGWLMTAEWGDVVDFKVLGRRNLRMIGSDKLEPCKCKEACEHLRPSDSAKKAFKFNPDKRYKLVTVLDGQARANATATAAYQRDTFKLLCDVSLCWPRPGNEPTRCTIDSKYAADDVGLEEGQAEDDEDTIKWDAYDPANRQHLRVLNMLLRHVYVHSAKPTTVESERLNELVDRSPSGFQVGETKHSAKRWYKLYFAPQRPCLNRANDDWTARAHSTERPYYFLNADGTLSIRCGCKCVDTQGRRPLGTLNPVQCSRVQFATTQFGPSGLLHLIPSESKDDERMWERSAKRIFASRKFQHPDFFCADRSLSRLDNLIRTTSAVNHIRSLRPAYRWSTGMPALATALESRDGAPLVGDAVGLADPARQNGNSNENGDGDGNNTGDKEVEIPTAHAPVAGSRRRRNKKQKIQN